MNTIKYPTQYITYSGELFNEAYPSGSSSVVGTRAVALVDILLWSLDVRLTADNIHTYTICVCVWEDDQTMVG